MSQEWKKVTVGQGDDSGLTSAFHVAKCDRTILDAIKAKGVETLRDFIAGYESDTDSAKPDIPGLKEVITGVEKFKDDRVMFGRLKSAWDLGRLALSHADRHEVKDVNERPRNFEEPLEDRDYEEMDEAWKKTYPNIEVDPYIVAGRSLVNVLWRELRNWNMSCIEITKMKNQLLDQTPVKPHETPLDEYSSIHTHRKSEYVAHDCIQYYYGLRVWGNGMARAGNYDVPSKLHQGKMVKMFPFSQALSYPDRCLQVTQSKGMPLHEQLPFMERCDRLTRHLQNVYVVQRYPAGEALELAIKGDQGGLDLRQG